MGCYYYFIASLPLLEFDKPAPMTFAQFKDECGRQLSPDDLAVVSRATLGQDQAPTGNTVLDRWAKFNRRFRNELVRVRAKHLGKESLPYLRGDHYIDGHSVDEANQAQAKPNLLESERHLDRYRWQKIEELASGHFFDLEVLIAYALKLQILERYQAIFSPRGEGIFSDLASLRTMEGLFA